MKVCLLYENRERAANAPYYDQKSIIQDLGLSAAFSAAAKELTYENGELKQVEAADLFVLETFRNVMMTPLLTEEEIVFRQEIVKDCLRAPKLIRGLYRVSTAMLAKWNELGRGARERIRAGNPVVRLTTEIRVLRLFVDSLAATRYYLNSFDSVTSRGLQAFREEFFRAYPEELEADVRKVLEDIAFYMEGLDTKKDEERNTVVKPRIVFECGLEDGLKMSSVKLCSVGSEDVKYIRPGSAGAKLRKFVDAVTKDGDAFTASIEQEWKPTQGPASEQQTPILIGDTMFVIQPKDAGARRAEFIAADVSALPAVKSESGKDARFGLGPYLYADGAFWILDDEGVLSVYEYKDDRFERLAAHKILPGADSWGPIAFAGGLMILRDSTSMVCLDLRNEVQQ